jgi:hypothetical protein
MTTSSSPTQVGILATRIAGEALESARAIVASGHLDTTLDVGAPIYLNATMRGNWQIHSTSKLLTIDASVPLTAETTASADALAIALVRSFWTTAIGRMQQ